MNEVNQHLENFIANNEREWFGVTAVQRDCRISYNNCFRVIELGIKKGLFEKDINKPYRARMVADAPT